MQRATSGGGRRNRTTTTTTRVGKRASEREVDWGKTAQFVFCVVVAVAVDISDDSEGCSIRLEIIIRATQNIFQATILGGRWVYQVLLA